jgi:ABC-type sugar transport system permease subunit
VFLSDMANQAFRFLEFGYASAIAWVLALLVLAVSLVQFRYLRQSAEF